MQKGAPRNFTKPAGKHLCQSLSFNKAAGLRPATFCNRCFPLNSMKPPRTPRTQNTYGQLLLQRLFWHTPLTNYAKGKRKRKNKSDLTHLHSSIRCLPLQVLCDVQNVELIQEFLPAPFCY